MAVTTTRGASAGTVCAAQGPRLPDGADACPSPTKRYDRSKALRARARRSLVGLQTPCCDVPARARNRVRRWFRQSTSNDTRARRTSVPFSPRRDAAGRRAGHRSDLRECKTTSPSPDFIVESSRFKNDTTSRASCSSKCASGSSVVSREGRVWGRRRGQQRPRSGPRPPGLLSNRIGGGVGDKMLDHSRGQGSSKCPVCLALSQRCLVIPVTRTTP